MKEKQGLYDSLHALYMIVFEKVILARDSGKINKIPYERIRATDLTFDHWHGHFHYDWDAIEFFTRYKWDTSSFVSFLDNEIKVLTEYDAAVFEIKQAFNVPEDAVIIIQNSGLYGFARLLMHQIPNEIIHHENIEKYIDTFINDYETYKINSQFDYHVQSWLGWLHFESEQIPIGKYLLRKPNIDELAIVRPQSHHIDDLDRFTSRSLLATSIFEFNMSAPTQHIGIYSDEIRRELEACIDVFRLFKVGNVTMSQLSVSPYSVLEHGHSETLDAPFDQSWKDKVDHQHTSRYEYMITKEEESLLLPFFEKLKPILHAVSPKNYLNGTYLDLALHRYKDALLRSQVNVNRLVAAITTLEALMSNSTSEITYKISVHVAGLLRLFGFEPVRVFEKMQTAYSVRSTLIHGSKLKEKLLMFSDNHTHEIVNYARICLLTCLQLETKCNKDSLIKKIDYSLFDNKSYEELKLLIKENVLLPIPYPFRSIDNDESVDLIINS